MKTPQEILSDKLSDLLAKLKGEIVKWDQQIDNAIIDAMKEYAKKVLRDFDNWKAHKTPELIKNYIKEQRL